MLARSFAPLRMTERKPAPSIWKSAGNRKNGNRLLLRNFIRSFLDNLLGPKELQVQVVNEAFHSVHGLRGEVAGGAEEGGGVAGGRCPVGPGMTAFEPTSLSTPGSRTRRTKQSLYDWIHAPKRKSCLCQCVGGQLSTNTGQCVSVRKPFIGLTVSLHALFLHSRLSPSA